MPQSTVSQNPDAGTGPGGAASPPGYDLFEEVGRGGMGVVYRARDLALDREVAVKLLLDDYAPESSVARRFLDEARITGQLQHPGIPAIYQVGALANGRPFLAMKLIRGQTLEALLKAKTAVDVLSVFAAISQAVGYAHAHGVIHRDLKPQNVMVGAFGEVQVMDWGLAKVLTPSRENQRPESDPEATTAASVVRTDRDSDSPFTQYGSVLGTPAFMAPEQAAGELDKIGPAADVFGLGAILCVLLTGKPPYEGTNAESVRIAAVRGQTEGALARLDASGADPEVIALCKRCLAFEPGKRPAHGEAVAVEVARLRQAADERVRQAERDKLSAEVRAAEQAKRRRAVQWAGGAIAAVLLLGLGASWWQMDRAVKAEKQAIENERATTRERDAKDKALKAETVARQKAMTALRSLTDDVVENQLARGTTLTDENKAFLRKIIEQYEGFAAITADDAESRAIQAEGHLRVGVMRYRLGELQAAEAAFADAVAMHKQLADGFPDRPEYRQGLGLSCHNRALLFQSTGRLKEAEASYAEALAIQKQLAADFPDRPEVRQDLARGHNNLGILLRETGRLREAESSHGDAIALLTELAAEFPTQPKYRQELASGHNNLGILLRETGRLSEAQESWHKALGLQKQLVAEFPNRPEVRQELASSHNNLAFLLRDTGLVKEAGAAFNAALALQKQLAAEYPTRPGLRQELARSYNNVGILFSDTGRPKEAEAAYADGLAIQEQLAADFPERPEFRRDLAITHNNLGLLLEDTGRFPEAEVAHASALAIRKQLATDFPEQPEFRRELASSHNNLGTVLRATGRFTEAEAAWRSALTILKQLATEFPEKPELRQELAGCHNNLGILAYSTGRPQQAEAAWRDALSVLQELASSFPNLPDLRNLVANTLNNLAVLFNKRRDFATAKQHLAKAGQHHQAALKANPHHPTYRRFYRNHLWALTQAQAGILDQAAALRTAETLRDLGWDPPANAYDAGCVLSRCISIVEMDDSLNADAKQAAVQFYGDQAMTMLRTSVNKGLKNVDQLSTDTDLAPLRERNDFKELLESLAQTRAQRMK